MTEVLLSQDKINRYGNRLKTAGSNFTFLPFSETSAPYCNGQSMSSLVRALEAISNVMDLYGPALQQDGDRLIQMGELFEEADKQVKEKISQGMLSS
ncbi:DUF3130 family protein [Isobaculum melis]|uniref:Type VII secretion effector, SACOL2603 family n=1 Tax=Isobaculum melis TaxID=142588 RepID=A0A1H9TNW8_9LACT|nr:DUF3130 family protein [Isobaculum melis]SER98748.1 type VII secretion effector, SACOL2603 family [Isobaculum melis]